MRKALLALVLAAIALPAAQIPRPAPDLTIKLPDGKTQKLSQYRGKVVALQFILTTCSHCQRASRILNQMQKEFGARGFQALAVAINPMANMLAPDYVRDFQLTFPVGYDTNEVAHDFLQHSVMMRMMMPQLVFIDRTGVIRAQYAGSDAFFDPASDEKNVRAKIEELLKDSASSAKPAAKKKSS